MKNIMEIMPKNDTNTTFRILIVDDNVDIHDDFKKILLPDPEVDEQQRNDMDRLKSTLFGLRSDARNIRPYTLDSAYSGNEAIQAVQNAVDQKRPYAIAFVDVLMPPGLDGFETTKEIWKVDPHIQIVICTAYSNYTWEKIIEELGINANFLILKKPFDNIEVKQLACNLANRWQQTRMSY